MSVTFSGILELFSSMLNSISTFCNDVLVFLGSTLRQLVDGSVLDTIASVVGLNPVILETPIINLILGSGITFVLIYSLVRWAIP